MRCVFLGHGTTMFVILHWWSHSNWTFIEWKFFLFTNWPWCVRGACILKAMPSITLNIQGKPALIKKSVLTSSCYCRDENFTVSFKCLHNVPATPRTTLQICAHGRYLPQQAGNSQTQLATGELPVKGGCAGLHEIGFEVGCHFPDGLVIKSILTNQTHL